MRQVLIVVWLMLQLFGAAYHFGPGQRRLALDEATGLAAEADRLAAAGQWQQAFEKYNQALSRLPEGQQELERRIRLARAKVQMMISQLPAAHDALQVLVDELAGEQGAAGPDSKLLAEAREALAHAKFYMTWLMRLEGVPRERWEPMIESSRELLRLLAERATGPDRKRHLEDLEAAVRLARMDLAELQALPLPSQ